MLTIVRRTAALWWRTWPRLVALYLTGWFVRYWVLQFAISIGIHHGELWGSIIMAVVPIVRLLTYLGMFLVIRSAATGLQHVDEGGAGAPRGVIDVTLTAVLPFLVIYTLWKLVVADFYVYFTTVNITTVYEGTQDRVAQVVNHAAGAPLITVIVVAFLLRQLITRFRERLPAAAMLLAVYFQVLWLFLTIQASFAALFGTADWIAERRIVVWYSTIREQVLSHLGELGRLYQSLTDALGPLAQVIALSLAWLAIASAVYGTPLTPTWQGGRRAFLGHRGDVAAARAIRRGRQTLQPRWQRVPVTIQERAVEFLRGQLGMFGPIVDAGRLILHGGALPIAFFVLVYTALVVLAPGNAYFDPTVTDGYLFRAVAVTLGPHQWAWWQAFDDTIRLIIDAAVDPIRICLVAATYWFCVDQVRAQQAASGLEPEHQR
ncbi:hypothetical protein FK535_12370 [Mycolicibacterium sp. 018/SC-01/001]|uniref:hypothetical protein n=1 Tax=Mycolicibacterium sp. 018/SC-01/001 TaxID=2592069 RepID=UPI00117C4E92|nr:hypothetical protein [Mycolicibacterium sp. 018/SC-01/001]TRW82751.1 hypothetical protein FK535_12370 [Mycolicibacterium sp. 018/SC-01/001]